jgi:hypothetical protein
VFVQERGDEPGVVGEAVGVHGGETGRARPLAGDDEGGDLDDVAVAPARPAARQLRVGEERGGVGVIAGRPGPDGEQRERDGIRVRGHGRTLRLATDRKLDRR